MRKDKVITTVILAMLGLCFLLLNGCGGEKEFDELVLGAMKDVDQTAEQVYVVNQIGKLEQNSDCLNSIGCVNMKSGCFSNAGYYGCIDCFGVTVGEDSTLEDLFSEKKIYGGMFGSSCLSCYWVKFPLMDSNGNVRPAYGFMMGE
ncbi:MAG: hypothetical protein K2P45_14280 [Eubacterium sp.]|nr:hypothetical protein [Eubacterium sp.]